MIAKEPGRLESWKEIGEYLQRDVRTLGRWEKEEGLPIPPPQSQEPEQRLRV